MFINSIVIAFLALLDFPFFGFGEGNNKKHVSFNTLGVGSVALFSHSALTKSITMKKVNVKETELRNVDAR